MENLSHLRSRNAPEMVTLPPSFIIKIKPSNAHCRQSEVCPHRDWFRRNCSMFVNSTRTYTTEAGHYFTGACKSYWLEHYGRGFGQLVFDMPRICI